MSQLDDTLRQSLRQQLDELLETNEGGDLLHTRVGRITLRVPRDREGRFSAQLFDRYQRSERDLVLAFQVAICKVYQHPFPHYLIRSKT